MTVAGEESYRTILEGQQCGLSALVFVFLLPFKERHQRHLLVASNPTLAGKVLAQTFGSEISSRQHLRNELRKLTQARERLVTNLPEHTKLRYLDAIRKDAAGF